MRSYRKNNFSASAPCVVALGCFDGVHIGHRAVISETMSIARERAVSAAVWTFEEPPRNFFAPNSIPIITEYEEKRSLMRRFGIDIFVCIPFDENIASMEADEFFEEILVKKLQAVHIVCGFNYSFGKSGKGNPELLAHLCHKKGIGFTCIPPVSINGVNVSSSIIRSAIEAGDIETANEYLGRPFSINTIVTDGQKLARRLGFPTVNQEFRHGILVPRYGVYITRVKLNSKCFYGITNVGVRPTVEKNILCAETHILEFDGDLYGKNLSVEFLHFIRPEAKFSSVELLANQVRADIELSKKIISEKYSSNA